MRSLPLLGVVFGNPVVKSPDAAFIVSAGMNVERHDGEFTPAGECVVVPRFDHFLMAADMVP